MPEPEPGRQSPVAQVPLPRALEEGLTPAAVQARYDRLSAILADMMGVAAAQAQRRCPYRDRNDRCTADVRCRNQRRVPGEPAARRCAGDDRIDYRSAWEVAMPHPIPFIVIGENLHATRVVSRSGRHVVTDGDREWLAFTDRAGAARRLPVPAWHTVTDDHQAGRLKHVAIAIRTAMADGHDAEVADAYLRMLVDRQVAAGAAFLDLNVDELSPRLSDQQAAIAWLVRRVQGWTDVPVAVDSSHAEILAAGLSAARPGSRTMLNSASLERRSSLELGRRTGGPVVVTAAGERGMPSGVHDRVANATTMVESALAAGYPLGDVHIDPLMFPVSVDSEYGTHALDAIRALRARFGPEVHLTGGMSNVSFGLPARRLLNDVFLRLAIEAGADGGIIDPVATDVGRVLALDLDAAGPALARDAILGADIGCRAYLRAYRSGALAAEGMAPPERVRG